jgi:hypothetical protein
MSKAPPPGKRVVFRPWITRNGKRIYASQYGLRAFPIVVDE